LGFPINCDKSKISSGSKRSARLDSASVNRNSSAINILKNDISARPKRSSRLDSAKVNDSRFAVNSNCTKIPSSAKHCSGRNGTHINELSFPINRYWPNVSASAKHCSGGNGTHINELSFPINRYWPNVSASAEHCTGGNLAEINNLSFPVNSNRAEIPTRWRKLLGDVHVSLGVLTFAGGSIYVCYLPIPLSAHLGLRHRWRSRRSLTDHLGTSYCRTSRHFLRHRRSERHFRSNSRRRCGSGWREESPDSILQIFSAPRLLHLLPRQHLRQGRLLGLLGASLACEQRGAESLA
jgi:hypothetical protein